MKDKFEIFMNLMLLESGSNHYGCYISVGQMTNIVYQVNDIYNSWDDTITFKENTSKGFKRSIAPLGDAGRNRI
jgi:hypothetical protein